MQISSNLPVRLTPGVRPEAASSAPESQPGDPPDEVRLSSLGTAAPTEVAKGALAESSARVAQQAAEGALPGPQAAVLKVLSLNTYFDCKQGVDKIVSLIKQSGADLVGLQESIRNTRLLAKALGMNFVQQDKRTALLSRFPIEYVTPNRYGVAVKMPDGQKIGFCNAHLTSFPNQAYQLMHLPGGGGSYIDTEEEAISEAEKARGEEFDTMLKEADMLPVQNVVATGDFNEPSHLDWTPEAAAAGLHPIKVQWPGSSKYEKAGFTDSYREMYPDEVGRPGYTWTSWAADDDPKEKHDRIDFVHHRGPHLKLQNIQILGERPEKADIVITPYPTDHRSLLATFEVLPPA